MITTYNAELAELQRSFFAARSAVSALIVVCYRGNGASGGLTPSGNGVRVVFITIASIV